MWCRTVRFIRELVSTRNKWIHWMQWSTQMTVINIAIFPKYPFTLLLSLSWAKRSETRAICTVQYVKWITLSARLVHLIFVCHLEFEHFHKVKFFVTMCDCPMTNDYFLLALMTMCELNLNWIALKNKKKKWERKKKHTNINRKSMKYPCRTWWHRQKHFTNFFFIRSFARSLISFVLLLLLIICFVVMLCFFYILVFGRYIHLA